jgi:hypothetical protein
LPLKKGKKKPWFQEECHWDLSLMDYTGNENKSWRKIGQDPGVARLTFTRKRNAGKFSTDTSGKRLAVLPDIQQ